MSLNGSESIPVLNLVRAGVGTTTITDIAEVEAMVYVWLTNNKVLSQYTSVWVDFTDEWLDPFWDHLKGSCYTILKDEVIVDEDMMHEKARFYQVHLWDECPAKDCAVHVE